MLMIAKPISWGMSLRTNRVMGESALGFSVDGRTATLLASAEE
jgi:hypothetical protein